MRLVNPKLVPSNHYLNGCTVRVHISKFEVVLSKGLYKRVIKSTIKLFFFCSSILSGCYNNSVNVWEHNGECDINDGIPSPLLAYVSLL